MPIIKSADIIPSPEHPSKSVAIQAAEFAFGQGDIEASLLACLVANAHEVSVQELFHHSRSRAPIAVTRQLAMYLMHVALGRSLTEVGTFYGRDRTTVSYACAQLEDQRDDAKFDAEVEQLETLLAAAIDPGKAENPPTAAHNDD